MTHEKPSVSESQPSRGEFIKTSTAVVVGGALAGTLGVGRSAHAAGSDQIKIGLIGCGGRGSGAVADALLSKQNLKLVAMGDIFRDRLDESYAQLMKHEEIKGDVTVPEDHKFVGFDAYQKVLASGIDLAILATPPGFRPMHFEAAIQANKHVFMEKPVATDAPGVRRILATAEEAKKKNLGVGVGLQRRHQLPYRETIQRLQDGAIGDIFAARVYWNGSTPWVRERAALEKKKGSPLTEMEYQLRNWYYFTWICGDHIVEQHIHNMDVINWLKGAYPVRANGMGGCEVRKGKDYGETFDHHVVEFEYADGSRMFSQCRHIVGCWNSISEQVHGTKGTADISAAAIRGDGQEWRYRGDTPNPYHLEHEDLLASIRAGSPINEAEYGAKSTMTAILGRMATYSGQAINWDDAIASQISLAPEEFSFDATPRSLPDAEGYYAHAVPGLTKVI